MIYIIMRRYLLFTLFILSTCMASTPAMAEDETFGNVYQWHAHTAFTGVDEVVIWGDYVYALSANSFKTVKIFSGFLSTLNSIIFSIHISRVFFSRRLIRVFLRHLLFQQLHRILLYF